MIKAILFDFNGVIIDDETIQMKAYQEILKGHEIASLRSCISERSAWTTRRLCVQCLGMPKSP